MNRTQELRDSGAKDRGGSGGGAPFVKWSDDYAFIEGRVLTVWAGKFGDSASIRVSDHSPGLEAAGKNEDGEKYVRRVGKNDEVNVGLNYASLQDTITSADQGADFHIAFEGWAESKDGANRYRLFTVLELPKRGATRGRAAQKEAVPANDAPPHTDRDVDWPQTDHDDLDPLPF